MDWGREAEELFAEYTEGEYENEYFSSITDLSNSMPYQLSCSPPSPSGLLWAFQSPEDDDELRGLLRPGDVTTNISRNSTIKEKIKATLQNVCFSPYHNKPQNSYCLIQFWAPVQAAGNVIYLTTANQSFGLTNLHKGLCSYRRHCVSTMLLPVHVDQLDDEEKLTDFGPISRAFRQGRGGWKVDSAYNTRILGGKIHTVWPLLNEVRNECIGVLEILSSKHFSSFLVYDLVDQLKNQDLMPDSLSYLDYLNLLNIQEGVPLVRRVMEDICQSHELPLIQVWTSSSTRRRIHKTSSFFQTSSCAWEGIEPIIPTDTMPEGEGVAGKAFASRGACFCRHVIKLSMGSPIKLDPLIQELGLTACFAVCLQSTQVDSVYILEFFLPPSETNPRNFLNSLVASLRMKIQASLGDCVHNLGDKLLVEVIKTSSDDELDSFEVCDSAHITRENRKRIDLGNRSEMGWDPPFSVPEAGVDLQLCLGPMSTYNAIQTHSEVQSNSVSSHQQMNLDMHLVPLNSPYSVQEMESRQEIGDESTSFPYSRDYSQVQQRSSNSDTSRPVSSDDSDFAELNAFTRILRRDNVRF